MAGLLILLAILAWIHPAGGRIARHAIHLPTLEVLMALMILTQGIEHSRFLDWAGLRLIRFASHERALARGLMVCTGLLAALLTNDIALFIVVPLTVALRQWGADSWRTLVILEAFSANVGATLSPIGSPQNIYLWQTSHLPTTQFVLLMSHWVALLAAGIAVMVESLIPRQPLIRQDNPVITVNWRLFGISSLLYFPFLYTVESGHPIVALGLTLPLALLHRPLLNRIDWGILGIFTLFFIDVGWLSTLLAPQQLPGLSGTPSPLSWLLWGAGLSQIMSNVPATLYLGHEPYNFQALSFGVNAGGYGLVIGSMANLIALRLSKDRQIWLDFHRLSLPFFGFAIITALFML